MTDKASHEKRIEWHYALPAKKDRTLIYKILQTTIIVLALILIVFVFTGITMHVALIELLKGFGIIGGFLVVVMALCYPLVLLLLKLISIYFSWLSRITHSGDKQNADKSADQETVSNKSVYTLYHYLADEKKIHSWSAVETKGGKHIRYRNVKELICCKEKERIEISTLLGRTMVYATDDNFEVVKDFLIQRCEKAIATEIPMKTDH